MRNLKKLLSVVLVVAMIAGLCAVGSFSAAAAEYSETTNYKEAAAVITGVGIMKGYEDGTMQYDKTVTREEAAKIICMALIGVDTAEKLSTAVAPFADVAANRWSAPCINYLKSQGIVNGKTATQFDPTAEVTAVEFAKMMLCAVGYGKAGEFVGASWDVNTITAANNNGVYTGTLAADLTAPATREQCMLYAFNTMVRVPVVNYNTAFQSYYVGNSVVSNILTRVDDNLIGDSTAVVGLVNNPYPYTLAYRNFKLERTNANTSDAYGRPAVTWATNGKPIGEEVVNKTPSYVLYGAINSDTLYKTLGKSVVNDLAKSTTNHAATATKPAYDTYNNFDVYVNGVGPTRPVELIKSGETAVNNMISAGGDTVELYVEENGGVYEVTAIIVKQYFAQVTKVDTAANKLYATIYDGASKWTNCVADGEDVNINGLKKDDYILVNAYKANAAVGNGSTITAIATPKTAVVTYKGITFSGLCLNLDGNPAFCNGTMDTSIVAVPFFPNMGAVNLEINSQYTCYYDSLGNVIFAEFYDAGEVEGTTSYLYINDAEANSGALVSGSSAVLALDVTYTNGGEETVKVLVEKDTFGKYVSIYDPNTKKTAKYYFGTGTTTTGDKDNLYEQKTADTTPFANTNKIAYTTVFAGFFSYTKTADGFVKLSRTNDNYSGVGTGAYDTITGKAEITNLNGYTATTSTILTIIDANGNVETYNGYKKFPSKKLQDGNTLVNYTALYTFALNSTKLKSICIFSETALSGDKTFALCGGFASHDAEGDKVNFYVNGELKTINFVGDDSTRFVKNNVYELTLSADGNNSIKPVADYSGVNKEGAVNRSIGREEGYATATNLVGNDTAYIGLGHYNRNTMAIDEYYAWSIINDVDGNIFTTKAVKAPVDTTIYPDATAAGIKSSTYYFDEKTNINDCRDNKCVKLTELPANVVFIAYVDQSKYSITGVNYCTDIWIVG